MAGCEEQTFSGVRGEHVRFFLAKAEQFGLSGLAEQGNSGEVSEKGFSLRWHFTPETGVMTVQCTKAPMMLPCSMINGRIREAIASLLGSTPGAAEQS